MRAGALSSEERYRELRRSLFAIAVGITIVEIWTAYAASLARPFCRQQSHEFARDYWKAAHPTILQSPDSDFDQTTYKKLFDKCIRDSLPSRI